jgi:hypothetical protein
MRFQRRSVSVSDTSHFSVRSSFEPDNHIPVRPSIVDATGQKPKVGHMTWMGRARDGVDFSGLGGVYVYSTHEQGFSPYEREGTGDG